MKLGTWGQAPGVVLSECCPQWNCEVESHHMQSGSWTNILKSARVRGGGATFFAKWRRGTALYKRQEAGTGQPGRLWKPAHRLIRTAV